MRPGWMRHRIAIQRKTSTISAVGEPVDTWATYAQVWASVEPQRAREYVAAQSEQGRGTWTIKLRYRDDVSRLERVTWNGHTLEIESVISPYERRRDMELVCREIL